MAKKKTYGINENVALKSISAPKLPYAPRDPKRYKPNIGMIACGGITQAHLGAYKSAGYNVVALCDLIEDRAEHRRKEFFPKAKVYTDYRELLKRDDIEVVDIATHPPERVQLIEDSLCAGKHVLSQKPFVLNLDTGLRLADLADKMGRKLAVNQNGRWAPHFSYIRNAIRQGLIGEVMSAHLAVHWDHNWTWNTKFNDVHHLALYDFGIHWFDIVTQIMWGQDARRVFATLTKAPNQKATPPLLAQVTIEFENAQSSLIFDASVPFGHSDTTYVAGTKGTLTSTGPGLSEQQVSLYTAKGIAKPLLKGSWFPVGFHGTMAELLCSIEEKRTPINNARDNIKSLALCFAALHSADTGQPQIPGTIRSLDGSVKSVKVGKSTKSAKPSASDVKTAKRRQAQETAKAARSVNLPTADAPGFGRVAWDC